MRAFALPSILFLAACVAADAPKTISNPNTPPVTVKGNGQSPTLAARLTVAAFFANNKRFYIRGVDYQPSSSLQQPNVANPLDGSSKVADPLLDIPSFKRDIAEFKKLGINTIRVYTVDNAPEANHDEGMKMLADAGIYLALDVNTPKNSLNRLNETTIHASYNDVRLLLSGPHANIGRST
jgi:1,3-beta-glucanosyltransferase GAS5